MANKEKAAEKKSMSRKKVFWFSFAASILLLITTTAVWVNQQIFNAENFSDTVTTSITSESSRNAIAQSITDEIYADRPVAKRIAGDFTVKIVSGLLDTDQFENVLGTAVEKLQIYATSSDQQTVAIELGGVKDVIDQVTGIANNLGRETTVDTSNIPDEIVLVKADEIPDFYKYGIVFMWLAPISLLAALTLLAYPYIKKVKKPSINMMIQGATITVVGLFGLSIGPLFRPALLSSINKQNSRIVVGNLYDAFIATFNQLISTMIFIGVFIVLAGVAWYGYPMAKSALKKQPKKAIK